jgi:phosphopantothenoylcysteine decarboxylase/phosphopantothenate--cysteine ligase
VLVVIAKYEITLFFVLLTAKNSPPDWFLLSQTSCLLVKRTKKIKLSRISQHQRVRHDTSYDLVLSFRRNHSQKGNHMKQFLAGKHVLLGVTGSIAAYKGAELVRRLREVGAQVRVVMTENAKRFITPLTMQAVSGLPVHEELFDVEAEAAMGHIELARWADLILVAPASADCMARLTNGNASDLLTTLCLATKAPVMLAPAMNQGMWKHTATQANLQALILRGIKIVGPTAGSQACGDMGLGRMLEPVDIVTEAGTVFSSGALAGLRILITAGPTHEAIDPVRFISNGSSGKMGYALAQAAVEAGAQVKIISGPTALEKPVHMAVEAIVSAEEMYKAVMRQVTDYDIFIAAAAVSDYRVEKVASQKIHKTEGSTELTLIRTPDIVASVGQLTNKPFIVGFAAETEDLVSQAKAKRQRKNMNMIIANQVGDGQGMGSDDNAVTVITANDEINLPKAPKTKLARELIRIIATTFNEQRK